MNISSTLLGAAFALVSFSTPAMAVTLFGSLSNFDCINDAGEIVRGFEIELEGVHPADISFTFGNPYIRYGDPVSIATATGTIVRYASAFGAGGWAVGTPVPCEARREIPSNFEADAPLSQWARGFGMGHEYLSALWDAHAPTKVSEDLGSCLMVLTFFASRELAEEYQREFRALDRPLESFAEQMIDLFPEALTQYMLLGISIAAVLRQRPTAAPVGSVKIDRNDPCPCGSGKKYKDCCGAAVH